MDIYTNITTTITKAKALAMSWADGFIQNDKYGQDNGCGPIKLVLLTKWIGILEDYKVENFDDNGQPLSTPLDPCLSQDEMLELISKINEIAC